MAANETASTGAKGCPCIDESSVLSSLDQRACQTSDGQNGVLLTTEGPCAPYTYGSSNCMPHDMLHDPKCLWTTSIAGIVGGGNNNAVIPDYCVRNWCYVDAETCMGSSSERVYRSDYFPVGEGVDMVSCVIS